MLDYLDLALRSGLEAFGEFISQVVRGRFVRIPIWDQELFVFTFKPDLCGFSEGFLESLRLRVTGFSFGDLNLGFEEGLLDLISFLILTQDDFIDFVNSSKLSNYYSLFAHFPKDLTISSSNELF